MLRAVIMQVLQLPRLRQVAARLAYLTENIQKPAKTSDYLLSKFT